MRRPARAARRPSASTAAAARDASFLREALDLAPLGRLRVEPNPTVGCVVVRGGQVVGRGWHQAYGGPHAEVEALAEAGKDARGATVYVSLEPCTTTGKTPPCVVALARAGVARVVWASRDPNPAHAGRAARALRAVGIEAVGPALPGPGDAVLARFRAGLARTRPWTVLKWASSLDGRVAPARGQGGRLSGREATAWLHDLRGRVEAVAVGVGTVLVDDPRLTCRSPEGPVLGAQPAAVVFDSELRIPLDALLVRESGPARALFLATTGPRRAKGVRLAERPGIFPLRYRADANGCPDPADVLHDLHALGVRRLLVEGGPTLAGSLLARGLVDQVAVIVTPSLLGADGAPTALVGTPFHDLEAAPRLQDVSVRRLGDDVLIEGYVPAPGDAPGEPRPATTRARRPGAQRG